jgi:nucleoside-diphosphate-sugar epimerase
MPDDYARLRAEAATLALASYGRVGTHARPTRATCALAERPNARQNAAMQARLSKPLLGRVVVTGASGFIGGQLRDALLAGGADVVSLVRPSSGPAKKGRSAPVDYSDLASLRSVLEREKPDYVFHVAGATKGVSYQDFQLGNVMPTERLMQALVDVHPGLKRFVHVSSLAAYGPSLNNQPKHESHAREPVEHYGKSKLEAEQAVESFGDKLPWTIVRPSIVYGPGEADMFALFRAAHMRVNLFYGNRHKRASAVYVDDLLEGMVNAAQAEQTRSRGYFFCDGVPHTWAEIQDHIVAAVGRRALTINLPGFIVPIAGAVGETLSSFDGKVRLLNRQKAILDAQEAWLCTHTSANTDFGYKPSVHMAEGTRRTYKWYRDNRWL